MFKLLLALLMHSPFAFSYMKPLIVGGLEVKKGERSAVVGLVNSTGKIFCTGTLIHPKIVLTAAHCIEDEKEVFVHFGEGSIGGKVSSYVSVLKKDFHPRYEITPDGYSDVAYLELKEEVLDIKPIKPLYLPYEIEFYLRPGVEVFLIGFGLREHGVPGGRKYGLKFEATSNLVYKLADEVVIQKPGVDACNGDSGGPALVRLDDGEDKIFGVVSRGPSICDGLETAQWGLVHANICWLEEASGYLLTHEGFCSTAVKASSKLDSFINFCSENLGKNNDGQALMGLFGRYQVNNCEALFQKLTQLKEINLSALRLSTPKLASFFTQAQKIDLSYNFISDLSELNLANLKHLNIMWNNLSFEVMDDFLKKHDTALMGRLEQRYHVENTGVAKYCDQEEDLSLSDEFFSQIVRNYNVEDESKNLTEEKEYTKRDCLIDNTDIFLNREDIRLKLDKKIVGDLAYFKNFTLLNRLIIDNVNVINVSALENLTSLTFLGLSRSNIFSVEELVDLIENKRLGEAKTNRITIDLSGNNIIDLSPFENITKKQVHLILFDTKFKKCVNNKNVTCQLPFFFELKPVVIPFRPRPIVTLPPIKG